MARSLNGTSDLIDMGNPAGTVLFPAAITLAGWCFPTSLANTYSFIIGRQRTGNANGFAFYLKSTGALALYITPHNQATQVIIDPATGSLSTNSWQHTAYTYSNASGAFIFVNGAQTDGPVGVGDGVITPTDTGGNNPTNFQIGNDIATPGRNLASRVADAALWSTVLSSGEIAALAKGARPFTIRPGSLGGYWPIDGLQSPEPDFSGNANNGTLTGTANASGPPIAPFTPRWGRFVGWTPMLPASGLGWIINRRNKLMVPKKRA